MLPTRLKLLRKHRKISQAKLAHVLGLTQQSVAKWEKNQSEPQPSTLKMIANYFNVTVDFLLDNEKEEPLFTEEELRLVESYRQLDNPDKAIVFSVLDRFKQSALCRQAWIDQSNNNGNLFNVNGSNNVLSAR